MDANTIIAGFAVSTVGFGFFMYGKKQARPPQMAFGLIAMIYPYFVGGPWLVFGIFAALLALMWIAIRTGY
ncbi:MAG TPA: hypothetical protein VNW92_22765 [Polyangiaceae bacterium]|jgi:hypothetical protein|nr:hypothetical protein [Polyangiaceae bacterium]